MKKTAAILSLVTLAVAVTALTLSVADAAPSTPAQRIVFTKTASNPNPKVGEIFTFTLVLSTTASETQTMRVKVLDPNPAPAYLNILTPTITGGGTISPGFEGVVWEGTLDPASTLVQGFDFQVQVIGIPTPSLATGFLITNTATVMDVAVPGTLPEQAAEAAIRIMPAKSHLPLVMRAYPPSPEGEVTITDGDCVHQPSVTLALNASVEMGEVTGMRIRNEGSDWTDGWETFSATRDWELEADSISGPRTVYAQFIGNLGGLSLPASDTIYLAWDGDFERGWGDYWTHDRGPFKGKGSGLNQEIVFANESFRTLLGDPDAKDGAISVGYAYISQEFVVPDDNPRLSLDYFVYSRDTVWGQSTTRYFDTFEVSINRPPGKVTDQERHDRGCRDRSELNPKGTVTPSADGLVFCGGQPPITPPHAWNSGWRTVTLDLGAFAGQKIKLYAVTWSREYNSPFYNDRGYYNTYAYVDNITVEGD